MARRSRSVRGSHARTAGVEERRLLALDQFDAQSVGRHLDLDLLPEVGELRLLLEHLPDLPGHLLERLRIAHADHDLALGGPNTLGRIGLERRLAARDGPVRLGVVEDAGVLEVSRDGRLDGVALRDEPHDEEEGHHRGHEVGIRHLPRAAMVAAVPALLDLLDDDDRRILHDRCSALRRPLPALAQAAAAFCAACWFDFLQYFSVSSKVGRTSPGSTRRANSTAITGGKPL